MLYKLRLICSESDDFLMEITVDGTDTFLTLHQFIQNDLGYDSSQMASFFTTDSEWHKEVEITLMDMGEGLNDNLAVMDTAIIEDYIQNLKQRMLYVFDYFSERAFFIEVCAIEPGKLDEPVLDKRVGIAPDQIALNDLIENDNFNDEFDSEEELDDFFKNHDEFESGADFDELGLDVYNEDY